MNRTLNWIVGIVLTLIFLAFLIFVWPVPQIRNAMNAPAAVASPVPIVKPTAAPASQGSTVVVTATGMSDIGSLLGNQPMTPVVGANIVWDELKKMPKWIEKPCLTGDNCLYVQSGKTNEIDLPLLPGKDTFVVPDGTTLVFGAFSGDVTLGSGKSYSYTNGFYGAFTEGTRIKSMHLADGFALLILRDSGQTEYCMRVAQAMNQKWAYDHLYRPSAWTEPVCQGVVTTVIDPND